MNELLVRYVQYSNWANMKLVETAEQLDAVELMSGRLSKGNAFETLRHVLDVEWSWRMFVIGTETYDSLIWDVEPLDDLPSVKARWRQEGEELLRYVESLSEDDLARRIPSPSGKHMLAIRDIIMHILNHATNHRSELGWYFTYLGHSPGDLEFLDFTDTLDE